MTPIYMLAASPAIAIDDSQCCAPAQPLPALEPAVGYLLDPRRAPHPARRALKPVRVTQPPGRGRPRSRAAAAPAPASAAPPVLLLQTPPPPPPGQTRRVDFVGCWSGSLPRVLCLDTRRHWPSWPSTESAAAWVGAVGQQGAERGWAPALPRAQGLFQIELSPKTALGTKVHTSPSFTCIDSIMVWSICLFYASYNLTLNISTFQQCGKYIVWPA